MLSAERRGDGAEAERLRLVANRRRTSHAQGNSACKCARRLDGGGIKSIEPGTPLRSPPPGSASPPSPILFPCGNTGKGPGLTPSKPNFGGGTYLLDP